MGPPRADGARGLGRLGRVSDLIRVEDPADPRLADYLRLTDSSLRTSLEAANGLFIAEGEKVIRRALGAGYPVKRRGRLIMNLVHEINVKQFLFVFNRT